MLMIRVKLCRGYLMLGEIRLLITNFLQRMKTIVRKPSKCGYLSCSANI